MTGREQGTTRRRLGVIEVDSGTLLVADPSYVLPHRKSGKPGIDYAEVVAVPMSEDAASLCGRPVLLLQNFGGDGSFPVFGDFDDGELLRIVVEFMDPATDEAHG